MSDCSLGHTVTGSRCHWATLNNVTETQSKVKKDPEQGSELSLLPGGQKKSQFISFLVLTVVSPPVIEEDDNYILIRDESNPGVFFAYELIKPDTALKCGLAHNLDSQLSNQI